MIKSNLLEKIEEWLVYYVCLPLAVVIIIAPGLIYNKTKAMFKG